MLQGVSLTSVSGRSPCNPRTPRYTRILPGHHRSSSPRRSPRWQAGVRRTQVGEMLTAPGFPRAVGYFRGRTYGTRMRCRVGTTQRTSRRPKHVACQPRSAPAQARAPVRRSVWGGQGTAAACHRAGPDRDRRSTARTRGGRADRGRARARGDRRAGGRGRAGRRRRDRPRPRSGHRHASPAGRAARPRRQAGRHAQRLRRHPGIHRRRLRDADTAGGAVAAQLAHASAQAPAGQHTWDDPLTGLGNRHAYERRIAHECARRSREVACSPSYWSISTASRATAYAEPWPPCCSAGRGRSTASTGSARTGSR